MPPGTGRPPGPAPLPRQVTSRPHRNVSAHVPRGCRSNQRHYGHATLAEVRFPAHFTAERLKTTHDPAHPRVRKGDGRDRRPYYSWARRPHLARRAVADLQGDG